MDDIGLVRLEVLQEGTTVYFVIGGIGAVPLTSTLARQLGASFLNAADAADAAHE